MKDYVNSFEWGMPPHAGGEIGTLFVSQHPQFILHDIVCLGSGFVDGVPDNVP